MSGLNPYEDTSTHIKSPGQQYQELAGEIRMGARLLGLELSQNALATLIGEIAAWWRTSDHAKNLKVLVNVIEPLVMSFLAKKEG